MVPFSGGEVASAEFIPNNVPATPRQAPLLRRVMCTLCAVAAQLQQQYPHPYRHQFGFMKYLIRIYLLSQPVNFFSQNAADIRL
jgi:hypothetical protein